MKSVLDKLLDFSCGFFQFAKGKIYCNYRAALRYTTLAFCNQRMLGIIEVSSPIRLYQIGMMLVVAERTL